MKLIMKRYIKYSLLIVLALSYSACQEEFMQYVPQDGPTVGSWYKNAKEIRQTTATLYGTCWWKVTDQFSWLSGDLMSGDMYHNWTDEGQFFYMSFNESNQYIQAGWQGYYNVISNANLIIDDMPPIAKANGVSETDINKALAEARFVRGYSYFMLVEHWKEAPIIEKPAEKVLANNLQLPRATPNSLYEFARRDLVFAAENLPATDEPGRVTSWSAKGMLAKLHVTLGQHGGKEGIGSALDFDKAAEYAADVINNSGLKLNKTGANPYEDLFKIENEHNPEILFAPAAINGGWSFGSSRQARFARSTVVTGDNTAWGSGKCAALNYINNLKANANGQTDLRRRAIYMELGDKYPYLATKIGGYTYQIVSKDTKGANLETATATLTNIKKQVVGSVEDHGFAITNQDSPLDIYFLRLADVYLLYAEAMLGTKSSIGPGNAGYDKYLEVRARAGLGPLPGNYMDFERLFNERRVELGMEAQGWLDVKRRYYRNPDEALAYLNAQDRTTLYFRINSNDALENDPAGYEKKKPGEARTEKSGTGQTQFNNEPVVTFDANKMRLPIPATEKVANPFLRDESPAVEYVFK
jgi:starch-binding outer membrane protein, SusD/RagB family